MAIKVFYLLVVLVALVVVVHGAPREGTELKQGAPGMYYYYTKIFRSIICISLCLLFIGLLVSSVLAWLPERIKWIRNNSSSPIEDWTHKQQNLHADAEQSTVNGQQKLFLTSFQKI